MNAMIVGGAESGAGSEKRRRWDFILTGDPLGSIFLTCFNT